jgi:hypothetical protein
VYERVREKPKERKGMGKTERGEIKSHYKRISFRTNIVQLELK